MLPDDEQADDRPRDVQGRHRGDDVVARGVSFVKCEGVEIEVEERVLDDRLYVGDQPLLRGEPRRGRGYEEKGDVRQDRHREKAEEKVGEASAPPESPDREGEYEGSDEVGYVHRHGEGFQRARVTAIEVL